jgi:hypothetical protein
MYVCSPLSSMCCDCFSSLGECTAYIIHVLRCCCDSLSGCSAHVVALIQFEIRLVVLWLNLVTLPLKCQRSISCMAVAVGIIGRYVASKQNIIHNAELDRTNHSPNFTTGTERILVFISAGGGSRKASVSSNFRYWRSPTKKNARRFRKKLSQNCNVEGIGVPLTWRIFRGHASYLTTSSDCKCSCKMRREHTVTIL